MPAMLHWCRRLLGATAAGLSITLVSQAGAQQPVKPPRYVTIEGNVFESLLPGGGKTGPVRVGRFSMRVLPVTEAEFARFVVAHADWRRSAVADSSLADARYLAAWRDDLRPVQAAGAPVPVTGVSWFAAQAYCESEQARLPTWHEWEYAAAADATRRDARADPAWRDSILAWYGQTSRALQPAGAGRANVYGVHDLHGLIWEWVHDAGALMMAGDSREQGDPDLARFCGAGALSANDRANYPVLMRMAMLSSLRAASTNRNLGFRCVRPESLKR